MGSLPPPLAGLVPIPRVLPLHSGDLASAQCPRPSILNLHLESCSDRFWFKFEFQLGL